MMWRTAFTQLAALSIEGVARSYDLHELPNSLAAAELPALLPVFPEGAGREDADFSALTYDGTAWAATLVFDHLLCWGAAWSSSGLNAAMPALIDVLEAYLATLRSQGRLGGALSTELAITRIEPGIVSYGGVRYFGLRFRHRWTRIIAG